MKHLKMLLLASIVIFFTACSDGDSSSGVTHPHNTPPVASDFNMILDVNESTAIGDWKLLSHAYDADGDSLSASIAIQGNNGVFVVAGDSLSYLKATDTNEIDTGVLEISDGTDTIQITVTAHSLYWKQISAELYHTVAIKSDGTLWAWGQNDVGQLGNGTTTDSSVPVQESTKSSDWSSVSAGKQYTVAIKSDATLWAWGRNDVGQLGNGTTTNSSVPVQESTASSDWSSVNAGDYHTAAIKSDGTLWAWGVNIYGQLGNGTTTDSSVPVQESTKSSYWSSVNAGGLHTVAIKSDGTLWAWGFNSDGQLGNGTTTDSSVPFHVSVGSHDWSSVSAGGLHTVAIKSDGTLWAWGDNEWGQLGDGTTDNRSIPTQVLSGGSNWRSVGAGEYHTAAIRLDGTLWAWGYNRYGELGNGTTTDSSVPVQESTASSDWSSVSVGSLHTIAVKSDGALWVWGRNDFGQLGNGTTTDSSDPISVLPRSSYWSSVSTGEEHTVAIRLDGTLWAWGDNEYGQLGNGTTTGSRVPVPVLSGASNWSSVSTGVHHTVAIKSDGTLWAWGNNLFGQLGNGTRSNSSVPVQESTASSDWSSVGAGSWYSTAIKSDGTLWAWGDNEYGQLGNGTTTGSSIPIQESTTSSDWSSVGAGEYHIAAIKSDGTLWAWGFNLDGELGNGTNTDSSVPVQEHTASSDWSSVSAGSGHTAAVKSDATLWAWGYNFFGQLGNGTNTDSNVPVQESTASSDWSSVSAGGYYSAAIKSDGTLWAWGLNDHGELGNGTNSISSVPVQESTASSDWSSVNAGDEFTTAIKSDGGTLWAWGANYYGQLGNGTNTDSSVPVQVPQVP